MFDQIPSYFHINISLFILLAVGIVGGLFAYYQYKRTVPPIAQSLQIFLGIIRGMSFAGIVLLLFAPEITAIWQKKESGKLLMVIDRSASMGIIENGENRLNRALSIAEEVQMLTEDRVQIVMFAFDNDTMHIENFNIDTTRLGTNLGRALSTTIKSENTPVDIILLTDGNFTLGDNPLYSEYINKANIYPVGLGDTTETPDLLITDVKRNKIVYQNQPTELQVHVMSRGINNQKAMLSMKQGNKILQAKSVNLSGSGKVSVVSFEVIPNKVGLSQYRFVLEYLPDETIRENNVYSVSMEVLKSKVRVGFVASMPDYETRFLQLLLNKIDDIELKSSIFKKSGDYYYSGPDKITDSLDVLIMYNYPHSRHRDLRTESILKQLSDRQIPALIVFGEQISGRDLKFLQSFFPLHSIKNLTVDIEAQVQPTIEGRMLPIISIFESEGEENVFWNKCPPIQYAYTDVKFQSPVNILLTVSEKRQNQELNNPVLIAHEGKGSKSVLLLGSGFWRWHFLLADDRIYRNSWQMILKNIIRWLDSGTSGKNVIISLPKKNFQVGENVLLTTQVYDGSFNIVNNALIRTKISGPSATFEIESAFIQNGRYEGSFVPLVPGIYQIKSEAWRNDIKLGEDSVQVVITKVNREFINTQQNYRFLNRLAEKTGGKYFAEANARDLVDYLKFKPKISRESRTFELWNRLPILLVVIFLLSLEWFIRKRKGLA